MSRPLLIPALLIAGGLAIFALLDISVDAPTPVGSAAGGALVVLGAAVVAWRSPSRSGARKLAMFAIVLAGVALAVEPFSFAQARGIDEPTYAAVKPWFILSSVSVSTMTLAAVAALVAYAGTIERVLLASGLLIGIGKVAYSAWAWGTVDDMQLTVVTNILIGVSNGLVVVGTIIVGVLRHLQEARPVAGSPQAAGPAAFEVVRRN